MVSAVPEATFEDVGEGGMCGHWQGREHLLCHWGDDSCGGLHRSRLH